MEQCPVCSSSSIVKSASDKGEEIFCKGCRRILVSATLDFRFAKPKPEKCTTVDGLPGFKGPGERAVCHPYTNEIEKKKAEEAAAESFWSWERRNKRSASVKKLSTPGFTGAPSTLTGDSSATTGNPSPTPPQDFTTTGQSPIGQATAPGGIQPGDLNGSNPLNSATTSSKRLAELISDEMGPSFCTEHMTHDECNHGKKPQ